MIAEDLEIKLLKTGPTTHLPRVQATIPLADLRGRARGPNSFNFIQFLGNFGKIVCWRPLEGWCPRPRGNPGSATDNEQENHV